MVEMIIPFMIGNLYRLKTGRKKETRKANNEIPSNIHPVVGVNSKYHCINTPNIKGIRILRNGAFFQRGM
jgi:hypothetical protein